MSKDSIHINTHQKLSSELFSDEITLVPNRMGFGEGLLAAGKLDESIVALCADLTESTQMELFKEAFPERFIEIGVAEQNLVTVGSGLAAVGKKPFVTSYAGFSPGRNWEQIRTTICLNNRNVKIIGSHAGVSVGPDGATHQMLEDIALMRVLSNMTVIVPADSIEARKATMALAKTDSPAYLRLAREKTAVITTDESPFEIGKAQVLVEGHDITLVACGPLVYEALKAAHELHKHHISAEVINCATIKPLDSTTIIESAKKTKRVVTIEEAQIAGGLGGAVSEALSTQYAVPVYRVGIQDRFGQSGTVSQLWQEYEVDSEAIIKTVKEIIKKP
ncbi:transketolase family protein [Candidatus Saccharibacteria bacterium]|nr:transketolase family protein [Candidatus Saccharibacteria bacterium]